jgi:hypothetical protein
VSWIVTLTDRELLPFLYEAPWFELDLTTKKTLRKYLWLNEENPDADMYYDMCANDDLKDEEIKAFLETRITNPAQDSVEFQLPSGCVLGWGNVQLSEMAKEEVEAYLSRPKLPLAAQWPTYDDTNIQ